jgi:CheY-like chemotaxis protein
MSLRVLVVDDEARVAQTLQAYLEDEGMEAHNVRSAEAALELVGRGATFDVCIMDMRLPGMSGDEAIRNLHRLRPGMKFVIHTGTPGFSLPKDLRAMGMGEQQLFTKPLPDMAPLAKTVWSLGTGG